MVSSNPDALAGVDAQRVAAFQTANGKALVNLRKATQANKVSWTVVAAASEGWAAKVFPELATSEEQVDALWNEIFKTTRIYEENPVIAWDIHDKKLQEKAAELNEQQFTALHYTAPGTDLTIGLPKTIYGKALVVITRVEKNSWLICQQKKFSPLQIVAALMVMSLVQNH